MSERSRIIEERRQHRKKPTLAVRRAELKAQYESVQEDIKELLTSPANIALMVGSMIIGAIKVKPVAVPKATGFLRLFQKKPVPPIPGGGIIDFALNLVKNPLVSRLLTGTRNNWMRLQVVSLALLAAKKGYDIYRKRKNQKAMDLSLQQLAINTTKKAKKVGKGFFR